MREITLQRRLESPDGTIGDLLELGLKTVEEEWRDNEVGESRIPAGTYICRRSRYYTGGYDTYEVTGVVGRSRILFHVANTEEDLAGCIAPGLAFSSELLVTDEETGARRRKIGVTHSKVAFKRFMEALRDDDEFVLKVYDVRPDLPEPEIDLIDEDYTA